jgi:cell division septum initiation protein DivIVA
MPSPRILDGLSIESMLDPRRPTGHWLVGVFALGLVACSAEAMQIVTDATETASTVFEEAKDDARIQRDHVVSRRLGGLSVGSNRLTVQEPQPLRAAVAAAKADGKVTLDEADRILIEMERAAARRPVR